MTITQLKASGFMDDMCQDKVIPSAMKDGTDAPTQPYTSPEIKNDLKKKKNDVVISLKRNSREGLSSSSNGIRESQSSGDAITKKRKDVLDINVPSARDSRSERGSKTKSGYIVGSENRFYQEKKKSKRKKLRS